MPSMNQRFLGSKVAAVCPKETSHPGLPVNGDKRFQILQRNHQLSHDGHEMSQVSVAKSLIEQKLNKKYLKLLL